MYTVSVRRDFVAQHFLTGGDWGKESRPHSHSYRIELALSGTELDAHGYLVNIVEVERHLDEIVERYRDRLLNDFPELSGQNPSLENFARVLCHALAERMTAPGVGSRCVTLWESELAWASYRLDR